MGKITWGYIWRLIGWILLVAIILGFITSMILGSPQLHSSSYDEILSYYKRYLIFTLISSVISLVLGCKFATSGIQKKFSINSENIKQVFKCIAIVLAVLLVITIAYEVRSVANVNNAISNIPKTTDADANNMMEELSNFCKVFSPIAAIVNVIATGLMIPYEKKLLKA